MPRRVAGDCAYQGADGVLRVPAQDTAQVVPRVHHPQHAGQAHPLRGVGQGAALPETLRQVGPAFNALHRSDGSIFSLPGP